MTSSTKPEVNNVSERRQTRTEPRPEAMCTKIGEVRPCGFTCYASGLIIRRINKQVHSLQYFTPLPGRSDHIATTFTEKISSNKLNKAIGKLLFIHHVTWECYTKRQSNRLQTDLLFTDHYVQKAFARILGTIRSRLMLNLHCTTRRTTSPQQLSATLRMTGLLLVSQLIQYHFSCL